VSTFDPETAKVLNSHFQANQILATARRLFFIVGGLAVLVLALNIWSICESRAACADTLKAGRYQMCPIHYAQIFAAIAIMDTTTGRVTVHRCDLTEMKGSTVLRFGFDSENFSDPFPNK